MLADKKQHAGGHVKPLVEAIGLAARLLPEWTVRNICQRPGLATRAIELLDKAVSGIESSQDVRVAAGLIAGLRLQVDLRRQKYFWMGTYEPWIQDAIRTHARPGMHLWDVGAFIGFHTLAMRRIAGPDRVLAIEPDPFSRAHLARTLTRNRYDDVVVLPVAIGAQQGRARLKYVPDGPSQTSVLASEDGECETTTLDVLLDHHAPPELIKMDIEGAEDAALTGAARLLHEARPVWIIETHGLPGQCAVEQLHAARYHIRRIDQWISAAAELVGGGTEHVLAVPLERLSAAVHQP